MFLPQLTAFKVLNVHPFGLSGHKYSPQMQFSSQFVQTNSSQLSANHIIYNSHKFPDFSQFSILMFLDTRGCCSYQVASYLQHGQKNGLSPQEYLDKVFNIGPFGSKRLIFIKVIFSFFIPLV